MIDISGKVPTPRVRVRNAASKPRVCRMRRRGGADPLPAAAAADAFPAAAAGPLLAFGSSASESMFLTTLATSQRTTQTTGVAQAQPLP